jgi:hypothetical protein
LQQHSSVNPIGAERDFGVSIAFQYLSMHFPVAHPAAAVAALRIHDDFAGEFLRSKIKVQSATLQLKSSANRVEYVAKRETNDGVLRIQLERHILRRTRNAGYREKCNRSQEWPTHSTSAESLDLFFHRLCSQQSPPQSEPVESEMKRRKSSHVQGQQSAKNFGTPAQNLKSTLLEPGVAVEHEHQSRHQQGALRQATVRGLVSGETSISKTIRQHCGLAEGKAETFARDRIDRS